MAMTAQGLADAITASQGTATDDASVQANANLKLATAIVEYIQQNAVVTATIPSEAIATTGGPAAQTGPAAPVNISGTIG